MYVCGPTVYDVAPPRPRPVLPGLRRPPPLSRLHRAARSPTSPTSPTSTTRSSTGPPTAGRRPSPSCTASLRGRVVGGHGRARRAAARRDPPRHRLRRPMVDLVAELVDRGVAYETADGVYLSVTGRPRLRPPGPPAPRLPAGRGPGRGRRGEALAPRLRAVEEGQAGRADLGVALGAGPARAGTPSAWSCPSTCWATASTSTAAAIDLIFPHHENERAQAVAVGRDFARHWVHNGWVTDGRREDVQVPGQLHLPRRPAGAERRPRLPAAGAAVPLPLADRGHPGHGGRRRGGPGPAGRAGPPLRAGRPAGRRPGGRLRPTASGTAIDAEAVARFRDRMDDDLDTPGRPGRRVRPGPPGQRRGRRRRRRRGAARSARTAGLLCAALGLPLRAGSEAEVDAATAELVRRRDEARAARDWARADALRGRAGGAGWVVEDGPEGTRIRRQ